MRSRLAELEAERDALRRQNTELLILQQVLTTINSSLAIDDILSMVLLGVAEALEFGRVVLFAVTEEGEIVRRLEVSAGGTISAPRPREYLPDSTLHDVAAGTLQLAQGKESDSDKPLADTKGSYCIAPLISRDVLRGLLYADDPSQGSVNADQMRVLLDFAGQAAIAMENADLYEETRRLLEQTERLALTDPLTGIANRRAFANELERELHRSARQKTPFALAILDLDDLKKINDTSGHEIGDRMLQRFAEVLTAQGRKGDVVARYAGDEFVLVMAGAGREAAEAGVGRILEALRDVHIGASAGVALYPDDATESRPLLAAADRALYAAKQSGKGCYRFCGAGG